MGGGPVWGSWHLDLNSSIDYGFLSTMEAMRINCRLIKSMDANRRCLHPLNVSRELRPARNAPAFGTRFSNGDGDGVLVDIESEMECNR
jgi:hypothetical protein